MRWQTKSKIQRVIAAFPVGRETLYSLLQQKAGRQRKRPDPRENFLECAKVVKRIQSIGAKVEGARVMEVGTGWALDMPIALFLCGAAKIQTFDLHPYLRPKRVVETLESIQLMRDEVARIFAPVTDQAGLNRRLEALCGARTCAGLMDVAHIEYFAPADATKTSLASESIDIQFSYTVFEHIPENIIGGILKEASRVLTKTGFCLHHVDPSDHYSHDDQSISKVNFLQFSDEQWDRYAGNQFAYHNRSRAADFKRLFEENGHTLLQFDAYCDEHSLKELKAGFPLDAKFRDTDLEALCQTTVVALSFPSGNPGPKVSL